MERKRIAISVRSEGRNGYQVEARIPGRTGVLPLAEFLKENRGEAHAFKNGIIRGLELAAETIPWLIQAEGRSRQ